MNKFGLLNIINIDKIIIAIEKVIKQNRSMTRAANREIKICFSYSYKRSINLKLHIVLGNNKIKLKVNLNMLKYHLL